MRIVSWSVVLAALVLPGPAKIAAAGPWHREGFVANQGQWHQPARFVVRVDGLTARLEPRGFSLMRQTSSTAREVVRLTFAGASSAADPVGEGVRPGSRNYLVGDDRSCWRRTIPEFDVVRYHDLYPGVDARFYVRDGRLEYDFEVRPGGRLEDVVVQCEGIESLSCDSSGTLIATTPAGSVCQKRPTTYEVAADGVRRAVPCTYRKLGDRRFGFAAGEHDPSTTLVVDPQITFSSYLGGSALDDVRAVAIDSDGSIYVTGFTESTDFPTTFGTYDVTPNGLADAFVAKLDPSGSSLIYATYLGGNGIDWGFGIAVDGSGNAYVTGQTGSTNFPSSLYGYGGANDAFVAKLDATGSRLVYATYLGGASQDTGYGIALDATGDAYVVGQTDSTNFPTTAGAFDRSRHGSQDAFVAKLNAAGTALVYSTYLGGSQVDSAQAVAVDSSGAAYLTGQTASSDFPFQNGFDGIPFGTESYVTKLNAAGSALVYSTFLGGGGIDVGYGIAVNEAGEAFIAGSTTSPDFPISTGALDRTINGGSDAFVTRLAVAGNAVLASTFLGGSGDDVAQDLVLTSSGNPIVVGWTSPAGFPTTADAYDSSYDGSVEGFVSKLTANLGALSYSSLLGGSGTDTAFGIALDRINAAVVVGTTSGNFPTTAQAYDRSFNGSLDGFLIKLDFGCDEAPTMLYRFLGNGTRQVLGQCVSEAGDVNGDGYDDVLVAAPGIGTVRVYSGLTGATIGSWSDAVSDSFGASVSTAGDVDADGYPDVIIGAPSASDAGDNYGAARVFSGRTGASLYRFDGSATGGSFGRWVGGGGDVDRDGFADVMVGAFTGGPNGAGQALVYSGRNGAVLYTLNGDAAGDNFGWPVSDASDTNADGYADIAVGAIYAGPNHEGRARIYSGRNGSVLYTFTGGAAYQAFGFSLDGAGDVNADGFADVIVGSYANYANVYSGRTGALLYNFTSPTGQPGDEFGYSVAIAGDVNGDGFADLVVGAPYEYVTDSASGAVRAYSGKDGAVMFMVGGSYGTYYGWAVSGAGDVNRDGFADIVFGAPYDDTAAYDAGSAFVYSCHRRLASWSNYGSGWPGTLGVPSFAANADPVLCNTIDLKIGNSRGATTAGFLFVGLSQASTPTIYGGTLLVVPFLISPVPIAVNGLTLPAVIPCDGSFAGVAAYLQVLESDPGASRGVSFSAGLVLSLGF